MKKILSMAFLGLLLLPGQQALACIGSSDYYSKGMNSGYYMYSKTSLILSVLLTLLVGLLIGSIASRRFKGCCSDKKKKKK